MKRSLITPLLFVLIAITTACAAVPTVAPTSPPIPTQTSLPTTAPTATAVEADLTLMSDGRERSYHLYRPRTLDTSKPAPVVIFLHFSGGNGISASLTSGLNPEAERGGFIVVYPDATRNSRQWNAGICCGDAISQGIDDVAFINRLIDRLSSDYQVDPARIYVWGVSNGGMMAYRVACELSLRIAAIASSAGPLVVERCQPARPVSVVHFHSIADERSPFKGGMREGPPYFLQLAIPTIIERWRELDGCSAPPVIEQMESVTKTSSTECRDGTAVMLFTAEEGTHGSPLGLASGNITRLVLEFFLAHPKSH